MTTAAQWTGQSLARAHDPSLLTGRAEFVADRASSGRARPPTDPVLAAPAHVAFVRSPHAHARILAVDTSEAEQQPGVVAVIAAADLEVFPAGRFHPEIHQCFAQPLLAEQRVRFAGEPVAAVLATSYPAAVDAAEWVDVSYEPLPVVLALDEASTTSTLLFEPGSEARLASPDADAGSEVHVHYGGNVVIDTGWRGSDRNGPSPFDDAEVTVRLRTVNPRQSPAPIEPRTVICDWPDDGDLTVWAATQRPHGFRDELCALYRLEPEQVTVIAGPEVGGGFGGKVGRTQEERLMPALARLAGRPVVWVETRSEYLAAATQGRGEEIEFLLAGTGDGRITGLRAELIKDCGAYPITGAILPLGYSVPSASGPYGIPHVEFAARSVLTNRAPTSAFRGAGRAPYIAGLERLVDRYASEIGLDGAEVRLRNLVAPEQMPYTTPTGAVYDEADYPADLRRALELAGYEQLRRDQAVARADTERGLGGRQLGIGIACYNHITVGGGGEEAHVSVGDGGRARVVTGTTSQGHGHRTTWAQVAADVLGIAPDRIEVIEGRTDEIATGVGAVGSRSAQTAGVAVHRAAGEVVAIARELAADFLEAAPDDVVFDRARGQFHVVGTPAVAVGWAQLAVESASQDRELGCGVFMDTGGVNTYPSGAHVAVVSLDPETGAWDLIRHIAVDDAGRRINPMIVEGQLHGGIASGIAQVLGEVVVYDDAGNLSTGTFMDYQIVTADQLPTFELAAASVHSPVNELGVKGVGESGTIGATPAVHNAVLDALAPFGVTHLDLPCTPERVWKAIQAAGDPNLNCESAAATE